VILSVSTGWTVPLLFGREYQAAVGQLLLLSLGVVFRFASAPASVVLNTRRNAVRKFNIQLLAAIANIILNLALVPWLGITGASVATVLSEIGLAAGFTAAARADLDLTKVAFSPARRRRVPPSSNGYDS
jgi:O-antigen/teichoic acid export membrane protein